MSNGRAAGCRRPWSSTGFLGAQLPLEILVARLSLGDRLLQSKQLPLQALECRHLRCCLRPRVLDLSLVFGDIRLTGVLERGVLLEKVLLLLELGLNILDLLLE